MEITRVALKPTKQGDKILARCAVVVDDMLKLDGIELRESDETGKYLTLPSKQQLYKEITALNGDKDITFPKNRKSMANPNRKYFEEFYYPVDSRFYHMLLEAVVEAYENRSSDDTVE